jgi:hypothetical protein
MLTSFSTKGESLFAKKGNPDSTRQGHTLIIIGERHARFERGMHCFELDRLLY